MRKPIYLSPSSINMYLKDKCEFYIVYLSDAKPDRIKQTEPMSVGSAFDAYVKTWLTKRLFGNEGFDFDTIFQDQVEPHNRDFARLHGKFVFEMYQESGALQDMLVLLEEASEQPRFEFKVEGKVTHTSEIDGVPMLGKPDVYFKSKSGFRAIWDWKVTGYCGKSNKSPTKGYAICRDGWKNSVYGVAQTRTHREQHKEFMPKDHNGFKVNRFYTLDQVNKDWAGQLTSYGWLLGEPIGGDFVCCVDEICGTGTRMLSGMHLCRIATHSALVSPEFQKSYYDTALMIWNGIQNETLFTPEEANEYEIRAKAFKNEELAAMLGR